MVHSTGTVMVPQGHENAKIFLRAAKTVQLAVRPLMIKIPTVVLNLLLDRRPVMIKIFLRVVKTVQLVVRPPMIKI